MFHATERRIYWQEVAGLSNAASAASWRTGHFFKIPFDMFRVFAAGKECDQKNKLQRILKFHDTAHLRQRVRERELSVDEMKQVVHYHDSRTQQYRGFHGGFVYRFNKTAGGVTLAVVAEVKKNECWLISGFYEAHQ